MTLLRASVIDVGTAEEHRNTREPKLRTEGDGS